MKQEIISKIIQVAKENNCYLCLSDYREAEINMSTFEISDLPKIIYAKLFQDINEAKTWLSKK